MRRGLTKRPNNSSALIAALYRVAEAHPSASLYRADNRNRNVPTYAYIYVRFFRLRDQSAGKGLVYRVVEKYGLVGKFFILLAAWIFVWFVNKY